MLGCHCVYWCMKSPIAEIQGDLCYLVKLVGQGSLMAPDFHRKTLRRSCERLLVKYKVKAKRRKEVLFT